MHAPNDAVLRMVDFWQEQMRLAMGDERLMQSLLDGMLKMQQIMGATPAQDDLAATRSETPAGPSGDQPGKLDLLARRLALCEERLADAESRVAALESRA